MKSKSNYLMIALMAAGLAVGCSTTSTDRLTSDVNAARAEFLRRDPNLNEVLQNAAGYVIFPSVGKGGLGVGAAKGRGQLFVAGRSYPVGEATLRQVTVGLQAGAQVYHELIVFQDDNAINDFKRGNLQFAAQATAIAASAGSAAKANYQRGVMVFVAPERGLMAEASVGGQRFDFSPYLTPTGRSY